MASRGSQFAEGLHSAVSADDVSTLCQLLAKGANPDTTYGDHFTSNSKSILHIACGKGYTNCVRVLLEAGAMPDIHDKWGQTPLHYCLCSQFLDTASALLDHVGREGAAAMINSRLGVQQRSCLFLVAMQGSLDGVRVLLGYGAKVNDVDYAGLSPLMLCLGSTNWGDDLIPVMKMLVEAGADLEIKNNRGLTALQLAVLGKDVAAVDFLLSAGASVDSVDGRGRSALVNTIIYYPLVVCLEGKGRAVLEVLMKWGANLSGGTEGSSVLVNCIDCRCHGSALPLMRFFLERGADPDVFVGEETTPLLHAIRNNDRESIQGLLEHTCSLKTKGRVYRQAQGCSRPCTVDPIDVALRHGHMDVVRWLICAGDDVWRHGLKSELILQTAARRHVEHQISREDLQWFVHRLSSPPRLFDLTVYSLRSALGSRLHKVAPQLPLPVRVKDAIVSAHGDT